MAEVERLAGAFEELTRGAWESYGSVYDHAVRLSERNARYFWGVFGDVSREVVGQVEANRALAEELVERAEAQRGAFKTVLDESVDAYLDLVYAPLSLYREGLSRAPEFEANVAEGVERLVRNGTATVEAQGAAVSDILTRLPIQDYDRLNAAQVTERLGELSGEELAKVRSYEERNKNRRGLIAQIDRRMEAVS
jgi:Asp-tRNA(Asn)/Glu-tRNA(Gln) amidotransferase A subunit family amidase